MKKSEKTVFWKVFGWYLRYCWQKEPAAYAVMGLLLLSSLLQSVCTMLLPAAIVSGLMNGEAFRTLLIKVVLLALGIGIGNAAHHQLLTVRYCYNVKIRLSLMNRMAGSLFELPYEQLLETEERELITKLHQNSFAGNTSSAENYFYALTQLLENTLGLVLFGLTVSVFTPWIFILILCGGTVMFLIMGYQHKVWVRVRDDYVRVDTRSEYLENSALQVENGKDMRLYQMTSWYDALLNENLAESDTLRQRYHKEMMHTHSLTSILESGQNLFAYLYIVYGVANDLLSLAQFTLYITIVNQFASMIKALNQSISELWKDTSNLAELRQWFMEHELKEKEKQTFQLAKDDLVTVTFENVSYRYPDSKEDIVQNLSFTLAAGEKTALVGTNGAGKTTIVHLLMKLLQPTAGRILINGRDLSEISSEEYFKIVAPVFQQAFIVADDLAHNVDLTGKIGESELVELLQEADLSGKYQKLPAGRKTQLTRELQDEGVEFSGGETQKLMVARALYQDRSLLILDEPTSALDALAEESLYRKYHQMAKDKTSIFISHRLASTRFCDNILFIKKGQLTESGTHQELLQQAGDYAAMYAVQSQYYGTKGQSL